MRTLAALYLKELNSAWIIILSSAMVIVLLNLYLCFWKNEVAFSLSSIALSVTLIISIWLTSYLDQEWQTGTAYWLLSLPVSGYTILGAKFGLALTFLLFNLLLTLGGMLSIIWWVHGAQLSVVTYAWFYLYVSGYGIMAIMLVFLARTVGILIRRWRVPVMVGVFIFTVWGLQLFTRSLGKWFSFFPVLIVPTGMSIHDTVSVTTGELSLAVILAWVVYAAGLFLLTGYLLDRRVEV